MTADVDSVRLRRLASYCYHASYRIRHNFLLEELRDPLQVTSIPLSPVLALIELL